MSASAIDGDSHAVGGREHWAAVSADMAGRCRKHMLGKGNIDGRNGVDEAIVDHAPGTVTEQTCDVYVVAAGVHDRVSLPAASVARTVLA